MNDTTQNNEVTPDQEAQLDALVAEAAAREAAFAKGGNPDAEAAAAATAEAGKTSDEPPKEEPKEGEKPTEEKPKEGEETQEEVDARAIAKEAGIDYEALSTQFQNTGTIDKDAYDKLAKIGIPKEIVDTYIEGLKEKSVALSTAYESDVKSVVGAPAEYDAIIAWAGQNLSDAEIAAFDGDVLSGNKRVAQLAVSALHQRYRAEGGKSPNLIGGKPAASAGEVFASMDDYVSAINNPKYDKDAGYRKAVDAKAARSGL